MGEEEELYFGWGRRLEEETRWWVEEKKKIFDGNGEESGGWEKSEGKKIKVVSGTLAHNVRKFTKIKITIVLKQKVSNLSYVKIKLNKLIKY